MSIVNNIRIHKGENPKDTHCDFIVNNIVPPYERVAYKEVGGDLVVINKKIAAFVIDQRLADIKKELDRLINIQIEILASDGKS